jgi:hypothetical protein
MKNKVESKHNSKQLNILAVRRQLLPDLTLDEIYRIAERHLKNRMLDSLWQ